MQNEDIVFGKTVETLNRLDSHVRNAPFLISALPRIKKKRCLMKTATDLKVNLTDALKIKILIATFTETLQKFFEFQLPFSRWILGGAIAVCFTILISIKDLVSIYGLFSVKITIILSLASIFFGVISVVISTLHQVLKETTGHEMQSTVGLIKSLTSTNRLVEVMKKRDNEANKLLLNEIQEPDFSAKEVVQKQLRGRGELLPTYASGGLFCSLQLMSFLLSLMPFITQILFNWSLNLK